MISRIWHGWTTLENADIYENLQKLKYYLQSHPKMYQIISESSF